MHEETEHLLILPPEDVPQPEDLEAGDWDAGIDDSDVPIKTVIDNIVNEVVPKRYTANSTGGLEAKGDGDSFGEETDVIDESDDGQKELGRGKHRKQANRLYLDFWHHDSGTSENED